MPSETTPLISRDPPVGTYAPAPEHSSRSPCPVVNALANHGYIARSGRNIHARELHAATKYVGMTSFLGGTLANPPYLDYNDPARAYLQKPLGFWAKLWRFLKNPYTIFAYLGCWQGTVDKHGNRILDLETLSAHGAIEHDISLSRRDVAQKQGNNDLQKDLVKRLLASSSDGKVLTIDDFGTFVKHRIHQQLADNADLTYTPYSHRSNCFNIAMLLQLFGNGKSIPCSYVRALFEEERLPWDEGWRKRSWWPLGIIEFFRGSKKVRTQMGIEI